MATTSSILLEAASACCLLAALMFWGGARFAKLSPRATLSWAVANALFSVGTLLTARRADFGALPLYVLADALELVGFVCMHRGMAIFFDVPPPRYEYPLVVATAVLAMAYAYGTGHLTARLAIYCAATGWVLARASLVALARAPREFGWAAGLAIALPIVVAALAELLRGAIGVAAPGTNVADSLRDAPANLWMDWANLFLSLALNFALAGLVVGRLVNRIRDLTLKDPLTGVMNRRAIEEFLARQMADRRRHGDPVSVVYVDLDHFKALNDRHGHAAGDAAINHAVARVLTQVRAGDALGRHGGEEFFIVMPNTDADGASAAAERMRAALAAAPLVWRGRSVPLSASFGVATADATEWPTPEELLHRADTAMYSAKQGGRNRVVVAARVAGVESAP